MDAHIRGTLQQTLAENEQWERAAIANGSLVIQLYRIAALEGHPVGPALPEQVPFHQLAALVGPAIEQRLQALLDQQAAAEAPAPPRNGKPPRVPVGATA